MNPNQAFMMKLKPGAAMEYKKRHDELWPEMARMFKCQGISDYSIFLAPDQITLFAVRKVESGEQEEMTEEFKDLMNRWREHMIDLMETNPDNTPIKEPLDSVFYLP